nr:tetratricopeptide repeat protein [Candidatus Acidoferrales bacterium]
MKFKFLLRLRETGIALAILAATSAPIFAQNAAAKNSAANGAAAHTETVVVFPFENVASDPSKDWMGEGLSELTTDSMVGHGPVVFTRDERLAALEKLGLPTYSRFSRATMIKIAGEIDADYVVFGEFTPDGTNLHVSARVLRVSPPKLSEPFAESGTMDSVAETEARVSWRILCSIRSSMDANAHCDAAWPELQQQVKTVAHVRADSLEYFVRGLLAADDETRLRDLREASRLDPSWDEPLVAIGKIFYDRRDCESAVGWFAKVSATNAHSADAGFYTGVCQLLRNDPVHAEITFSGLLARAGNGPVYPGIISNLGTARLRQTRYKDAAADFDRAQKIDPGEPDYWFNLGLAQYLISDWAESARALREVVRLQPDAEDARALLIAALDHGGNTDEANALRQSAAADTAADPPDANIPHDPARLPQHDVTKMSVTSLAKLARVRMGMSTEAGR